jgi:hypothetical protein
MRSFSERDSSSVSRRTRNDVEGRERRDQCDRVRERIPILFIGRRQGQGRRPSE